jgi:hypothetical protein
MAKDNIFIEPIENNRRNFLKVATLAGLSTPIILSKQQIILAQDEINNDAAEENKEDKAKQKDSIIMNVALGLEFQLVAVYQTIIEVRILSEHSDIALDFQDHHKQHRDALASTIKKFGRVPIEARANYDIDKIAQSVGISELRSETDCLRLALKLEAQATSAYFGAIPAIGSKDVLKALVSIDMAESQHATVLRGLLGEKQVPSAFVS